MSVKNLVRNIYGPRLLSDPENYAPVADTEYASDGHCPETFLVEAAMQRPEWNENIPFEVPTEKWRCLGYVDSFASPVTDEVNILNYILIIPLGVKKSCSGNIIYKKCLHHY